MAGRILTSGFSIFLSSVISAFLPQLDEGIIGLTSHVAQGGSAGQQAWQQVPDA